MIDAGNGPGFDPRPRNPAPLIASARPRADHGRVKFLFVSVALLYVAILTVGALSGRIRLRQRCCAPSDPAKDLRMRAAFEDDAPRRP